MAVVDGEAVAEAADREWARDEAAEEAEWEEIARVPDPPGIAFARIAERKHPIRPGSLAIPRTAPSAGPR